MKAISFVLVLTSLLLGAIRVPVLAGQDNISDFKSDLELALNSPVFDITRIESRLVAVGQRGHILISDDHGSNWKLVKAPVNTALTSVGFFDLKHGWAAGHGGVVLVTEDGGETWTQQLSGSEGSETLSADMPFFDIQFLSSRKGYVVGAFGLLFSTTDGGRNWSSVMDTVDNPNGAHLYAFAALDDQHFMIAGELGQIFLSQDGGGWFEVLSFPYPGTLFGLQVQGQDQVYAYGLRGQAYRSNDYGSSWQKCDIPTAASLVASVVTANEKVLLAAASGQLLHKAESGKGCSFQPTGDDLGSGVSAFTEATDGVLVSVGLQGIKRVVMSSNP